MREKVKVRKGGGGDLLHNIIKEWKWQIWLVFFGFTLCPSLSPSQPSLMAQRPFAVVNRSGAFGYIPAMPSCVRTQDTAQQVWKMSPLLVYRLISSVEYKLIWREHIYYGRRRMGIGWTLDEGGLVPVPVVTFKSCNVTLQNMENFRNNWSHLVVKSLAIPFSVQWFENKFVIFFQNLSRLSNICRMFSNPNFQPILISSARPYTYQSV